MPNKAFEVTKNSVAIWFDSKALEGSYWQTFAVEPSQFTAIRRVINPADSP